MLTKEEATREMVEWHYKIDSELQEVYRIFSHDEDNPQTPINFLEVTTGTAASGSVMTFTFGPSGDIPYSMRIANITPDEMNQVRRGEIGMPEGWSLENSELYEAG